MVKNLRFVAAAALLSAGISAQDAPVLKLSSGTYSLVQNGVSESLEALPKENGMLITRVIQFTRPLRAEEVAVLEDRVGAIINYLPENAYIMALPNDLTEGDFSGLPMFAISPLTPGMKMTARVAQLELPDYAWVDDQRMEAVVSLFNHYNPQSAIDQLNANGFIAGRHPFVENALSVVLDVSQREALAEYPFVYFIQPAEDPGEKENFNAQRSARSNAVKNHANLPYDGTGVVVGHGDDGDIGPHIDYTGRILARKTGPSRGTHGDHVAGTIFGAGNINPRGEGMAPGAELVYYDYPVNLSDVDQDYTTYAVRVTNSSYSNGCNAGYTAYSAQMDDDIIDNPHLMHVFSAGNSGSSNCGYGAGSGWGNVTGGHKVGKNVIATANVTATDQIASSSSRGPAADGRIKPDIASVGTSVYSTINPNTYGLSTGTSMAAPGVAGVTAQLFQAYEESQGVEPLGGMLKAFLMNTADDLGNPGPDFIYGYGRMNALRAVRDIENSQFIIDSVSTGQTDSFAINVPNNTAQLRVMVYWSDPSASPIAQYALVNDLDAVLSNGTGTTWQPWVLDPTPNSSNLNANAVRARDSLNNAEQITVNNPTTGDYWISVNGLSVPTGTQSYYIVYSFVEDDVELTYPFAGEKIIAGTTETIYWDASDGNTGFTLEYSSDNGVNWSTLATPSANTRQFSWSVPNTVTDQALLRISRGSQTDIIEETMVIMPRPTRLGVAQACPDSIVIRWDALAGASEYEVYALGAMYMDSVARTADTFYVFHGYPPTTEVWYAVAGVTPNGRVGQRTNAMMKPSGVSGCPIATDVQLFDVVSPQSGQIPSCQDLSSMPVTVSVMNSGLQAFTNPIVNYALNGTTYTDTLMQTFNPGDLVTHTFNSTVNASGLGTYDLTFWVEVNGDGNNYNDSAQSSFEVISSASAQSVPYVQNFDTWSPCNTQSDCGGTVCGLFNGWSNLTNGAWDGIDWRTNSGTTPSSGTGPSADHTGSNGNYLYLEASGSCNFQEAILMSPCIDLSGTTLPEFSFWYNMNGDDIGELHVDLLVDGEWHNDIVPAVSGDQGTAWLNAKTSLVPWIGKVVTLRIRGTTGGDYQADMAIDDISITESTAQPLADFDVSNAFPCIGEAVNLIDKTSNVAATWSWDITPRSITYVNGTDSTSQNPVVTFDALGTYSIVMVASNSFGSDTMTQSGVVVVNSGQAVPFAEDFQNGFLPVGWTLENPDQLNTWEPQSCFGYSNTPTIAARVNNITYTNAGQVDAMVSPNIDLGATTSPYLTLDVSYSGSVDNRNDRLYIEVSTDCGATWSASGYDKTGAALATTIGTNSNYLPTGAAQWRRDTVDLSSFAGMSVKVRVAHQTSGGNNVYVDNIQIYDGAVTPPMPGFTSNLQDSCIAQTFSFEYTHGNVTQVTWDFGNGATPASATGAGPHQVSYTNSGSKLVRMTAMNQGGQTQSQVVFVTYQKAIANFSYAFQTPWTVQFADLSSGVVDSYFWDFNDNGATSTASAPVHTFTTGGDLQITMVVNNRCGQDTVTQWVYGISVSENTPSTWNLAPVPAQNNLALFSTDEALDVSRVEIVGGDGRVLQTVDVNRMAHRVELDVKDLPNGMYFVRTYGNQVHTLRFVIHR